MIYGKTKLKKNEKINFNVVKMKFLAMHITNQEVSFDIFLQYFKIFLWNLIFT